MRTWVLFAAVAGLAAQNPPVVENAAVSAAASAGSLKAQLGSYGAGPFWAAWQEPIVAGRHGDMCWSNGNDDNGRAPGSPVRLEGPSALLVLVRMEFGRVDQVRVSSPDCRFDGGGLAFHWISGVSAGESVGWLKAQVTEKNPERAILAIALHAGAVADQALEELTGGSQPEKVRERAAFWLGSARGGHGVDVLRRMLANDASVHVREQVVFALSLSKEPAGLAAVIEAAKSDKTPQVRSKALFWLAQKAANRQAAEVIRNAALNDPDRSVKEQAVFALKQLPSEQGTPLLIEVAKNNPDPAVRKKAMFWLGQSKDPKALDFFEQVLR